jgi:hypothetical protein
VRRVYLGLESGDSTVFRLLNKPGSPAACVETAACRRCRRPRGRCLFRPHPPRQTRAAEARQSLRRHREHCFCQGKRGSLPRQCARAPGQAGTARSG